VDKADIVLKVLPNKADTAYLPKVKRGVSMTAREMEKRVKLQEWAGKINECRNSGLTVRAWCAENGINHTRYYHWRNKLREVLFEEGKKTGAIVVPEYPALPVKHETGLVPNGWAQLAEPEPTTTTESSLSIEVSGCRISADAGTDMELLAKVCRVLRLL
jgi:hypothetical protein